MKVFQAHKGKQNTTNSILFISGAISCIVFSLNDEKLITVSPIDKTMKIFDVCNFDLEAIHVLDFVPKVCLFFEDTELNIYKIAM